jgi:DNA-binding transcriptional ArsR family regulator
VTRSGFSQEPTTAYQILWGGSQFVRSTDITATPTELAADLPVTRQAVAKHLAALRSAGLVEASRAGRETRYALTPAPLASAVEWIEEVGAAWDERLGALKLLVDGGGSVGAC